MKLSGFKALSFDCYGTLIDWETGLLNTLEPLLKSAPRPLSRDTLLAAFAESEARIEHDHPHLLYREILSRVHADLGRLWNLQTTDTMNRAFGNSVGSWPAFPDTPNALAYLKKHYKLIILSNVDKVNFAATNRKLGVTFDAICTAEDIGTYKPNENNFQYLLNTVGQMGVSKHELLHVAQSLYHDIEPAERLGISRCWINRRGDTGTGTGATKSAGRKPTTQYEFPSLAALAAAHEAGQ